MSKKVTATTLVHYREVQEILNEYRLLHETMMRTSALYKTTYHQLSTKMTNLEKKLGGTPPDILSLLFDYVGLPRGGGESAAAAAAGAAVVPPPVDDARVVDTKKTTRKRKQTHPQKQQAGVKKQKRGDPKPKPKLRPLLPQNRTRFDQVLLAKSDLQMDDLFGPPRPKRKPKPEEEEKEEEEEEMTQKQQPGVKKQKRGDPKPKPKPEPKKKIPTTTTTAFTPTALVPSPVTEWWWSEKLKDKEFLKTLKEKQSPPTEESPQLEKKKKTKKKKTTAAATTQATPTTTTSFCGVDFVVAAVAPPPQPPPTPMDLPTMTPVELDAGLQKACEALNDPATLTPPTTTPILDLPTMTPMELDAGLQKACEALNEGGFQQPLVEEQPPVEDMAVPQSQEEQGLEEEDSP